MNNSREGENNFPDLKEIQKEEINKDVEMFLTEDEEILVAYKTIRDQVIFTTKRVIVVNVHAVTGLKTGYFSYPYSKIQYFGIITAGAVDLDSELVLTYANGTRLAFDFLFNQNVKKVCSIISEFVL